MEGKCEGEPHTEMENGLTDKRRKNVQSSLSIFFPCAAGIRRVAALCYECGRLSVREEL
jgi:hypothetical protein